MPSSATITVLYFAGAQTATGLMSESVELPLGSNGDLESSIGFSLTKLSALLVSRHGERGKALEKVLECSKWSVDAEMVDDADNFMLKGGEEVAVIPPVSGG